MELVDVSDLVKDSAFRVFSDAVVSGGSVRLIRAEGASSMGRKEIDALGEFVKTYRAKGLAWISVEDELRGSVLKVLTRVEIDAMIERAGARKGDVLFIVADSERVVFDALGQLRCELARRLGLLKEKDYRLLWVTEFPLLEYDEEAGRYVAMHHPFTSPMDEDLAAMETDPGSVRAKAYDIVLNGTELGGGSIRIHDQTLQKRMFTLLGFTEEQAQHRFGFLLDAFRYGVPPHGGLAYGLDRIVMLLTGRDSIRDVIAFPKVQTAACLMTEAPSDVDPKQLDELGIRLMEGDPS
jgi:aspartyl-tRNA synthetase